MVLCSAYALELAIPNFQMEQNKTTDTVVASGRGPVLKLFIIIIYYYIHSIVWLAKSILNKILLKIKEVFAQSFQDNLY